MSREMRRHLSDVEERLMKQGYEQKKKKPEGRDVTVDVYSKNGKLFIDKETRRAILHKLVGSFLLCIITGIPSVLLLIRHAFSVVSESHVEAFICVGISMLICNRMVSSTSRLGAYSSNVSSKSSWESFVLPLVLGQVQRMYETIRKSQAEEKTARYHMQESTDKLRKLQKEYDAYRRSERNKDSESLHTTIADLSAKLAESEHRSRKWQRCAEYAQLALNAPVTKQDKEPEVIAKTAKKPEQVEASDVMFEKEQEILAWLRGYNDDGRTVYIFGPRSRWMFRVYEAFSDIVDDVVWIESGTKNFPSIQSCDAVFIFSNMVLHAETDALMNLLRQVGAFYWSSGTSSFNGFIRHMATVGEVPKIREAS